MAPNEEVFARLIKLMQDRGGVVAFVGAGISVAPPAGAPLGDEIKRNLLKALCANQHLKPDFTRFASLDETELLDKFSRTPLEVVLQKVYDTIGERALDLLEVVGSGSPNYNHFFLSYALANRYLKAIVTTNQDQYIERAFCELGVDDQLDTCIKNNQFKIRQRELQLFKLHGSLGERDSIVATLHQVGRGLEQQKARVFKKLLKDFPFIFAGYRGADFDIQEVLVNTNFKEIFWLSRQSREQIKKDTRHIINALERQGKGTRVNIICGDLNEIFLRMAYELNLKFKAPKAVPCFFSNWFERNVKPYEAQEILGRVYMHLDNSLAVSRFTKASNLACKNKDLKSAARSLHELAEFSRRRGDYEKALKVYKLVKNFARRIRDKRLMGAAAYGISLINYMLARYQESLKCAEDSIKLFNESESTEGEAHAFRVIAQVRRDCGEYREAIEFDKRAMAKFKALGMKQEEAWAFRSLAKTRLLLGDLQQAKKDVEKMRELIRVFNDIHTNEYGNWMLAELALVEGNCTEALEYFRELEEKYNEVANDRYLSVCINLGIGEIHRRKQEYDLALRRFEIAESESSNMGLVKKKYSAILGRLETKRLQGQKLPTREEYKKLSGNFSRIKIPWGVVHTMIGEALLLWQKNKIEDFAKVLDGALRVSTNLPLELKLITKLRTCNDVNVVHELNFP
jgi:tetratricopeptide (TPR) repeat protein